MRSRTESYLEDQVNAVVTAVIAEFGFKAALPWLLNTVAEMAKTALENPHDASKAQQFKCWSRAVQAVLCRGGVLPLTFEQRIAPLDSIHARGMGIRLDSPTSCSISESERSTH